MSPSGALELRSRSRSRRLAPSSCRFPLSLVETSLFVCPLSLVRVSMAGLSPNFGEQHDRARFSRDTHE
jgi:hypothetical protein